MRDLGDPDRQTHCLQMCFDTLRQARLAQTKTDRKPRCTGHSNGHGLAMDETLAVIMDETLQRMAEGMAEIQQGPVPGFELVAGDNLRLGGAALGNGVNAGGAAVEDVAPIGFEPFEKGLIADQPIFRDLGIAGAKLARRQSARQAVSASTSDGW